MPDLEKTARALAARLDADSLTAAERAMGWQRLEAAMERRPTSPRLVWAGGLAALAAAAAGAVIILAPRPAREPPLAGWYSTLGSAACLVESAAAALAVASECDESVTVAFADGTLTAAPGARLWRVPEGLRVDFGRVELDIVPRPRSSPFAVIVSHGRIVVTGTRFTVTQDNDRGAVDLESGKVTFEWDDGAEPVRLWPGSSLSWPRPTASRPGGISPPPLPPPRPDAMAAAAPTAPDAAEEIMRRLLQLRSQRRFPEALALMLEASRRDDLTPRQRERFSLEVGLLMVDTEGRAAACDHLRQHLARFPNGPLAAQAQRVVDACDAEP